jgi:hypothetical protein
MFFGHVNGLFTAQANHGNRRTTVRGSQSNNGIFSVYVHSPLSHYIFIKTSFDSALGDLFTSG